MATRLFVGGLAWATTDASLKDFFAQAGNVVSASVITDKFSGRSKGFGFVEMGSEEEAQKAVEMLNGQALDGRTIAVNEARPQEAKSGGNFGGGRGNFRGGDRGGHGGDRGGRSGGRRDY